MEQLLLTAREVGAVLRVGESTVFAMWAAGELPCVRLGRKSRRISSSELKLWVEKKTEEARALSTANTVNTGSKARSLRSNE
jgi:excisionase family DNA binding protein